jgi:hypothetical protein
LGLKGLREASDNVGVSPSLSGRVVAESARVPRDRAWCDRDSSQFSSRLTRKESESVAARTADLQLPSSCSSCTGADSALLSSLPIQSGSGPHGGVRSRASWLLTPPPRSEIVSPFSQHDNNVMCVWKRPNRPNRPRSRHPSWSPLSVGAHCGPIPPRRRINRPRKSAQHEPDQRGRALCDAGRSIRQTGLLPARPHPNHSVPSSSPPSAVGLGAWPPVRQRALVFSDAETARPRRLRVDGAGAKPAPPATTGSDHA